MNQVIYHKKYTSLVFRDLQSRTHITGFIISKKATSFYFWLINKRLAILQLMGFGCKLAEC